MLREAGGRRSCAVRLVSGTDRLLAPNKDILDSLKLKHPPRRRSCFKPNYDSSFTESDRDTLIPITVSTVTSALMSFPPSSAGGHDGLSPRNLRDLTCLSSGAQGTRLLNAITELTRVIVRGSVPPPVARLLCGAKLIAFTKKGGGVRPIAVGCTFRRLASKVTCQFATDRLFDQLLPVQLGVGVPAGADAAVHAARAYSRNGICKGTAMVKLDMENAFNSICRTAMTEVVHQHIPEIYQYVSLCYDQSSMLLFGEFQVESAEGVQQVDPLGPLLFALTINHLAHSSSSDLSIWYLDDCCIGGGEIDQLIRDIKNISEMGADIGLFRRTDKCEIISDDQEDASRLLTVLPGAKTTATVGSPIGNLSNLETFLSKAIDQLRLNAECMYFVEEGIVRIEIESKGQVRIVNEIKKGDYFGELALIDNKPRAASAFAVGKTRVGVMMTNEFKEYMEPILDILEENKKKYFEQVKKEFGD